MQGECHHILSFPEVAILTIASFALRIWFFFNCNNRVLPTCGPFKFFKESSHLLVSSCLYSRMCRESTAIYSKMVLPMMVNMYALTPKRAHRASSWHSSSALGFVLTARKSPWWRNSILVRKAIGQPQIAFSISIHSNKLQNCRTAGHCNTIPLLQYQQQQPKWKSACTVQFLDPHHRNRTCFTTFAWSNRLFVLFPNTSSSKPSRLTPCSTELKYGSTTAICCTLDLAAISVFQSIVTFWARHGWSKYLMPRPSICEQWQWSAEVV